MTVLFWTDEKIERAQISKNTGMNNAEVGAMFGVTAKAVSAMLSKAGHVIDTADERARNDKKRSISYINDLMRHHSYKYTGPAIVAPKPVEPSAPASGPVVVQDAVIGKVYGPFMPAALMLKDRHLHRVEILKLVCAARGVDAAYLRAAARENQRATWRQELMYLLRGLTKMSHSEIGGFVGDRDHTTVLYAYKKICKTRKVRGKNLPEVRADALAFLAEIIDGSKKNVFWPETQ